MRYCTLLSAPFTAQPQASLLRGNELIKSRGRLALNEHHVTMPLIGRLSVQATYSRHIQLVAAGGCCCASELPPAVTV